MSAEREPTPGQEFGTEGQMSDLALRNWNQRLLEMPMDRLNASCNGTTVQEEIRKRVLLERQTLFGMGDWGE